MFSAPWTETTMSDPYLDALEQLDQMRDRAFKAEAAIARVRERAGGPIPAVHGDWMAGYAAAMRDILSALGHDIEMEGKR